MNELWIDTRLSAEHMQELHVAISTSMRSTETAEEPLHHWKENAAGNVSRCTLIDKDNWFYETVLKKYTEKLFYRDWDNHRRYYLEKERPLPEFELKSLWVNYQKQHDHVSLHDHTGLYSFVVFMKIPTHWKEQHVVPKQVKSCVTTLPVTSDFQFVWSGKGSDVVNTTNFPLSPEDEGRMLFFPAWLKHQVYPFYECEEERVTISGNIRLYDPNRPKKQEISVDLYEEKEKMLKVMENSVKVTKRELESMKKEREKGVK